MEWINSIGTKAIKIFGPTGIETRMEGFGIAIKAKERGK